MTPAWNFVCNRSPREISWTQDHLASSCESCLERMTKLWQGADLPPEILQKEVIPLCKFTDRNNLTFLDVKRRSLTWRGWNHRRTPSWSASAIFPFINGRCQQNVLNIPILTRINWACKPSVLASATKSDRCWVGSNPWRNYFIFLALKEFFGFFCLFFFFSVLFSSNTGIIKML